MTFAWEGELVSIGIASLRTSALFMIAPLFGHASVPPRVRVAMALMIAATISPNLSERVTPADLNTFALVGTVIGEILVGVTLGFAVRMIFVALDGMGEVVSVQGGIGAAQVLNPASGISSAAMGSMFGVVGLGTWLAIDGHHALIRALVSSYEVLPRGGGGPAPDSFLELVGLGTPIFSLALQLSMPVIVAMMVSNVAVGILGRVIPQLNLITLQLPAHVATMLFILILGAHGMVDVIEDEMTGWTDRVLAVVTGKN